MLYKLALILLLLVGFVVAAFGLFILAFNDVGNPKWTVAGFVLLGAGCWAVRWADQHY